ncbi:unnamed protein product [Parnassius mnemosyne]|uniref:HAT C-terminal dimerisation domain-containing protein n=1 Tax=Parnassius mnemosyne TaxID=213953 RepID=A0AAV1LXX2_9NEOP
MFSKFTANLDFCKCVFLKHKVLEYVVTHLINMDTIALLKHLKCVKMDLDLVFKALVIKELKGYLGKPRAVISEDILDCRRTHETKYPILSKMARDFLLIPATSVRAERLFSKASLVIRNIEIG